ncbi:TPA: DUF2570 domain-containing protein [Yersinia enterocolitica]|uniref:Phage antitermination protein Q n=2 Tax=Yersinia enterocolitica TaxID=630 RepID=A0ABP1XZW3_YEREN|nr:DUF2570 domain-containing protein [Yersinia enterocolitica]CBX69471.1 unknown protein [Yersinia enterocolitica W22703]ADZ43205.1 hypothetical protein YE105_C2709 [Yersinia enterocolitica subsp. palearctica 105.5R(r)]AJJ26146.1 hypothetical protein CH48_245 [Yersinia enterocolitica]ALG79302.1 hypothetical protein XM56_13150 [Yersinia enterocolitica]AOF15597.1 DUF2570 domain-containing protein [Yersinia enterocolitica]
MKRRVIIVVLLTLLLMGLMANTYRLSAKQKQEHAQLQSERVVNQALGDIIDAYQLNEAANRAAVARQLESERRLRYEAEDRLKRFTLATASDNCAASRMPESGIDILRE